MSFLASGSATALKQILSVVNTLSPQVNFCCSPTRLSVQSMDSAHVAMVELGLDKTFFTNYQCSEDMMLGVSLAGVLKILACGEHVTLRADKQKQEITFELSSRNGQRNGQFSLKLLDIEQLNYVKEMQVESEVVMDSQLFQSVCRDLSQLGELVALGISFDALSFKVGGDAGSGKITFGPSNNAIFQVEEETNQEYAMPYLVNFSKACSVSSLVSLKQTNGEPLLCSFDLGEPLHQRSCLKFYLAPKYNE